jgi:hypothetical protein
METWKDCVGYESFYEVSDFGNVRSLKRPVRTKLGIAIRGGVVLKKIVASTGYEVVNFTTGANSRKQEHVHRLVLAAFIGPCPDGLEACHDDGVRTNNSLKNLRWDTRKANHQDKRRHGTYQEGPNANNIKLTVDQVKEVFLSQKSQRQISKEFGICKTTVARIKRQKNWGCVTNEIKDQG